jgi:DNA-binding response OmpR family regulator
LIDDGGTRMAGKCVLMIEDDEEMVALGELILAKEGFDVLSATSGAAGLDLLRDNDVDLVLLDIMMDDMDGWQVLEAIKADERLASIPVIMLTARHYLEDEEMTAKHASQFVSYVVKPFVVRELVQEVRKVLSDS